MPERPGLSSVPPAVPDIPPERAKGGGETPGRVGVIDIGSNTVRLVVYDAPLRLPVPIYNEKSECGLARGLEESGRLNAEGIAEALRSLARFIQLADAMGVERLDLVATAAVRDASDGPDFVAEIEKTFGVRVEVLSGPEEARMSALGLLSGMPEADGLVADLGGGSLELMVLDKGVFGTSGTLPLGHLRLPEAAGGDSEAAAAIIEKHLRGLPWLAGVKGRTLYGVGGSWRSLARVFIDQIGYPLHVIDGFTLGGGEALRLARLVAGLGPASLKGIRGIPPNRLATLPFAALVMERLLADMEARELVFSGFGMREGRLLEMLPPDMRRQDPLIAGSAGMAERTGRFAIDADEIMTWMAPLFEGTEDADRRLRLAAVLISDIGWSEHPDYRAEHTFLRALRLPFAGLSHRDRVFLGLAIFIRNNGDPEDALVTPVKGLLDDDTLTHVKAIGLALRLAHTLSGSAPGLLGRTRLEVKGPDLILKHAEDGEIFVSETVERRLRTLGKALGLKGVID